MPRAPPAEHSRNQRAMQKGSTGWPPPALLLVVTGRSQPQPPALPLPHHLAFPCPPPRGAREHTEHPQQPATPRGGLARKVLGASIPSCPQAAGRSAPTHSAHSVDASSVPAVSASAWQPARVGHDDDVMRQRITGKRRSHRHNTGHAKHNVCAQGSGPQARHAWRRVHVFERKARQGLWPVLLPPSLCRVCDDDAAGRTPPQCRPHAAGVHQECNLTVLRQHPPAHSRRIVAAASTRTRRWQRPPSNTSISPV